MVVSSFYCYQPLRAPANGSLRLSRECFSRYSHRRNSYSVIYASSEKATPVLSFRSKRLLHVWKIKDGDVYLTNGFPFVGETSLRGVHRCLIIQLDYYSSYIWIPHYPILSSAICASCKHPDLKECVLVESLIDRVKWDDKGLAVAIAQNINTGAVLMQGFVNKEALATTISSRKATFYSRSRATLWTKGETSMNFIHVADIFLDCDRDSIIYLGNPDGPTCHTGSETCYFSSVFDELEQSQNEVNRLALTTLYSLESTISKRQAELVKGNDGKPSWTKRLLQDKNLLCSKIREEADELCRTLEENEDKKRTASEMADVLYHSMVLLAVKDVKMEDVLEILRQRFSQSGIEEKRRRKQG